MAPFLNPGSVGPMSSRNRKASVRMEAKKNSYFAWVGFGLSMYDQPPCFSSARALFRTRKKFDEMKVDETESPTGNCPTDQVK